MPPPQTAITATLSVRDWPAAMAFYKAAFGAVELFTVPGGGVGQLAVDGAEFWVAEESTEHQNFAPPPLGGCSVRMMLFTPDVDGLFARAVAAGAKPTVAPATDYGWRIARIEDPAGHHWEIARKE